MSKNVVWSQRVKNEDDKKFLSHTLQQYKTEKGFGSNRDALVDIFKNLFSDKVSPNGLLIPDEVIRGDARELESVCELGFLKKLELDRRGARWYCLKQQGPHSTGKPIPLGNDPDSIRKICEACHTSWAISKQKNVLDQRESAILAFGESKVSFTLYACRFINPLTGGPQIQLGDRNKFLCKTKGKMVTIRNTCMRDDCQFLFSHSINVPVASSEGYMEFRNALEGPK